MSKRSRDKGAAGEREVCAILSESLGASFKRKLGQARDSGNDIDIGPYRAEVKRYQAIAALRFMEQSQAACAKGDKTMFDGPDLPLVVMREDGGKWVVMQPLDDWLNLYRESL